MTTKNIFTITLILLTALKFFGQTKTKSVSDKSKIDIQTIDHGLIYIQANKTGKVKFLTIEQAKAFANKWNNAKVKGPYKFIVQYWVDIDLKDGHIRTFRINGEIAKETNDWGFDIGDKGYIEKLWTETK